jgi:glycosyltransferase involved in cell wall biosynthesis
MRLTILNQFYVPDISPTAHLAGSLAEHRAALGDDVTVITSGTGYLGAARVSECRSPAGVRVCRVWSPRLGKARLLYRLLDYVCFFVLAVLRVVRLPRQDVIVSMTTPPYIVLAGLLHKLWHRRTRLVLWNMDCYPEVAEMAGVIRAGGLLSRLLRAVNRFVFRQLDAAVCLDDAMADMLHRRYAPAERAPSISVIPNWERKELFPRAAGLGRGAGSATTAHERPLVVLYLGNTGVGHSFDAVIAAARELRDATVVFRFVGGGSRYGELQAAQREYGLNNFDLRGYVAKEDTPAVLAEADCALITLRDEALGLMSPSKLHANLAMGLPVVYVGPLNSNVDTAISRFHCGVSLRNGDAAGLASYLRRLSKSEDLRETLRRRARQAFEAAYCDMQTLPAFDRLLESLLEDQADPQPVALAATMRPSA